MPKSITIVTAKLVFRIGRIFGKGGSALPGLVAERMNPKILSDLVRGNFAGGIIVITGTNGKTTTARLTAAVLEADGRRVLYNRGGSNLMRGLISTLIQNCDSTGHFKADTAVFEVDENAFAAIVAAVKPTQVVVTNLFRDQLDRYGEIDTTAQKLRRALEKSGPSRLHLNSDDPLVASLAAAKQPVSYFGVAQYHETALDDRFSADSMLSPEGEELIYSQRYYSHIGRYHTKSGRYRRPQPDCEASKIRLDEQSVTMQVKLNHSREQSDITVPLTGFYNVYNVLAAVSVAAELGISLADCGQVLATTSAAFGRFEKISFRNRDLYLLLVKNPVGFNQIIETFLLKRADVPVLIEINDNFADSRDVSWLWDVSFEALAQRKAPIIVSGLRATDMALRLKYANVANITTISNTKRALTKLIELTGKDRPAYIVPTYTAMLELRSYLAKKTGIGEYWQ